MTKRKKRILHKIRLDEVSAVDVPAQAGALASIMKRDPYKDEELRKRAALTSKNQGHTHLLYLDSFDGGEMNHGSSSWEDGHTHPWVRTADGEIVIGAAGGHTHSLAEMSKNQPEGTTPDVAKGLDSSGSETNNNNMTEEQKKQFEAMQKRAERAEKIADLTDAEKAYFKGLSDKDQDPFLAKSAEDRKVEVDADLKKREGDNPVIYTADNGDEFRKNDDPRVVKMARERDEERRVNKQLREEAEKATFEKRASDELGKAPGELSDRAALLKAVSTITDAEQRGRVEQILKSANGAFEMLGKTGGHGGDPKTGAVGNDAQDRLDAMAKKFASDEGISVPQGMRKALATVEGRELYNEAQAERAEA